MKRISLAVVLSASLLSLNAFSADAQPGLQQAYDTHLDVVNSIESGNVEAAVQAGLNAAVFTGFDNLRQAGEGTLADQLQSEWGQFQVLDLGDHAPMSQWLANYYVTLFTKTKGIIGGVQLAADINTLNYALPVVTHPAGSWRARTPYDRIEYRKHFIPFMNVTTYWTTFVACKEVAKKFGVNSQICGLGSDQLQHYVAHDLAPQMSDWVFAKANAGDSAEFAPAQPATPAPVTPSNYPTEQEFENSVVNFFTTY